MPKISVILPAYNASPCIRRMMDSLLAQSFWDFEIIAVDDGSTDETGTILDEYASRDKRVRVFHQQNKGVAMARQLGVDNAKGEYSIHADADDWVEPEMLKEMLAKAKAEDADVVIADFYNNKGIVRQYAHTLNPHSILCDILKGSLFGGLWNKLARTSLYSKYQARFFPNVNYCEDVLIWMQILQNEEVIISHLDKPYYHYVENPDSITHKLTKQNYQGLELYYSIFCKILPDNDPVFVKYKKDFPVGLYLAKFMNRHLTYKEERKEYKNTIKNADTDFSLRWKIGFLFLRLRMNRIAHLLIRF